MCNTAKPWDFPLETPFFLHHMTFFPVSGRLLLQYLVTELCRSCNFFRSHWQCSTSFCECRKSFLQNTDHIIICIAIGWDQFLLLTCSDFYRNISFHLSHRSSIPADLHKQASHSRYNHEYNQAMQASCISIWSLSQLRLTCCLCMIVKLPWTLNVTCFNYTMTVIMLLKLEHMVLVCRPCTIN